MSYTKAIQSMFLIASFNYFFSGWDSFGICSLFIKGRRLTDGKKELRDPGEAHR